MRTEKGSVSAEATEIDLADPAHQRPLRPDLGSLAAGGRRGRRQRGAGRQGLRDRGDPRQPRCGQGRPDHRRHRRGDDGPRLPGRRRPARDLRARPRTSLASGWSTDGRGVVGSGPRAQRPRRVRHLPRGRRGPAAGRPVGRQTPSRVRASRDSTVAVIVLVVVMALIEVVLLAGPAFAVGARKQQRSLALMSAAGGTPTQSRRVDHRQCRGARRRRCCARRGSGDRRRPAARPRRAEPVVLLPRPVRGPVAAPGRRRRLRPAQRVPGRRRAGVHRVAPGRRRRAGRAPGRPGSLAEVAAPRSGAARQRHRRLRGRGDRRRRGDDRRERHPGGARHDPVDPARARRPRPG